MSSVATDAKAGNGLKLEKKNHQKIVGFTSPLYLLLISIDNS